MPTLDYEEYQPPVTEHLRAKKARLRRRGRCVKGNAWRCALLRQHKSAWRVSMPLAVCMSWRRLYMSIFDLGSDLPTPETPPFAMGTAAVVVPDRGGSDPGRVRLSPSRGDATSEHAA